MTTELKIEGMTCGHCVAGVTRALRAVPGVSDAKVDLASGSARVTHEEAATPALLAAAVEEEGYSAKPAEGGAPGCACCAS